MTRMGNLSLTVKFLWTQKSGHLHQVPSLLRAITIEKGRGHY
jgi:hypothetical protein